MGLHRPIFFDPKGRRAPLTTFVLLLLAAVAVSGIVAVVSGVMFSPLLRAPLDGPQPEGFSASATVLGTMLERESRIDPLRNRQLPSEAVSIERLAFMPVDGAAYASLKRNAASLDGIIPQWLSLARTRDGFETTLDAAAEKVLHWAGKNAPQLELHPALTAAMSPGETARAFADPDARAVIIADLLALARRHGFEGIVLDLPEVPPSAARSLARFTQELGDALRQDGRSLSFSMRLDERGRGFAHAARLADRVIVQAHDEKVTWPGWGAPASQAWFEEQLDTAMSLLPRENVVISIGSYGFDPGAPVGRGVVPVQRAWDLVAAADATVALDRVTLNSHAMIDSAGGGRRIWMLDAASAFNQTRAAMAAGVSGVALWALGSEDPGIWNSLGRSRLPDPTALDAIKVVPAGTGAIETVRGAIVQLAPGSEGRRSLAFHSGLGLVVEQTFERMPGVGRIRSFGPVDPHLLALTFDDGPSRKYTPRVLDILAEKNVKATFYILGANAITAGDLMQRIISEGHDIGNHSFSHSDLTNAKWLRVTAELNATQRATEMQTGRRMRLFRAPYTGRWYEDLEATPSLLGFLAEEGYLIGGWSVDGVDYGGATADDIYERVVGGVLSGDGQEILLHDAGGDREATIAALPRIIDALSSLGYRFVTTHELAGLSRESLMPVVATSEIREAAAGWLRGETVLVSTWFTTVFPKIAIAAAGLGIIRLLAILIAAFTRRERLWADTRPELPAPLSVTVLVPAYNEEKVIAMTLRGLLDPSVGTGFEILVIDDGSTDRTSAVVEEEFGGEPRVRVLRKPNGGKAAALNHGLAHTDAEIVVAVDGDTVLDPGTIGHLVAPFRDPAVGAVAGKVVVGNRINLLTRFQALEYAVSQNLDRHALERCNAIGVVPGAIGAWRRHAVLEAGGYSLDTLAEDADLTLTLQRRGWRVVSAPEAIARTEAPQTLRPLVKQRFRWTFGMLQVAWKHLPAFLQRPTGVSLFTLPNILVFQFAFTLLAPLMDLLLLLTVLSAGAGAITGTDAFAGETLAILASFWLLFQTIDLLACAAGVVRDDDRSLWWLIPLVIVQRFTYRQILYWVAVRALLTAMKGTFVGWGKLVRTGSVTAKPSSAA